MVESASELLDYFRVVWKRKTLIIIVVIVCIVVGVVVKNSRYKPEVTYQARALVKIGKKAVLLTPPTGTVSPTGVTFSLVYLDSPGELAVTIPVRYGDKVNNQLGYQLEVRQFGELVSMVEIIMKGPDRGVERVLKEVVNMLIEEHRKKAEVSTVAFKELITKLKKETNSLREVIAVNRAEIEEVKSAERMFKEFILEPMIEIREAEGLEGKYNLLNILYLRVLDREESLNRNQEVLMGVRQQLTLYKMYIESLEGYNTTLISEIRNTAVKPKKENTAVVVKITDAYGELITKLKKGANSLREVVAVNRAEIEEVKSAERMFKESILEPMIEIRGAEGLEGKYNLLNILYLRVLDREESLNRNQEVLESNRQRLMLYKMYIESLEGNNTTLIGEIRSTAVKPKKINTTVIAGIAGLIMALFIAFFMEYIEESKLRRKGKRQVNLA
jgi:hypothetical protein